MPDSKVVAYDIANARVKTEDSLSPGKRIKKMFFDKQEKADPVKFNKYKTLAKEMLDKMIADLEKQVENGKLPIIQVPLDQTDSGIALPGNATQSHLKDDLFHMILQESAAELDLILEVQFVTGMDTTTKQPVRCPIMLCSVK